MGEYSTVAPARPTISGDRRSPRHDSGSLEHLSQAWRHIGKFVTDEERREVTERILSQPAVQSEDYGDVYLYLWLDSQLEAKANLLKAVLEDERQLNDSQVHRIWLQADRAATELGKDFFRDVLPKVLAKAENSQTANAVLESEETLSKLLSNMSDRFRLGESLVTGFLTVPSLELKNRIATWVGNIGATAVLENIVDYGEPTAEDLGILKEHFPSMTRTLERILESLPSNVTETDEVEDA